MKVAQKQGNILLGFANPAALAAFDASQIPDRDLAPVAVVNDTYRLFVIPSATLLAAVDGLNVIAAALPAGAVWVRQYIRNVPAQYEPAWFIDPVAGNDANAGNTIGSPLRTITEWCNRMQGATVTQDVTVTLAAGTVVGDLNLTLNIVSPAIVSVVGNLTDDAGHTVTGVTASAPATQVRGFLTSADNFTDLQRLRFTSGAMNNAICYVTGINGPATSAFISTPGVIADQHPPNSETPVTGFPAITDTYVVETLNTTLSPPNLNLNVEGSGRFIFQNLNFAFLFNGGTQVAFMQCTGQQPGLTTASVVFYGCALPSASEFFVLSGGATAAAVTNCWFNGQVEVIRSAVAYMHTNVFRHSGGSFGGLYGGQNAYIFMSTSNCFDSGTLVIDRAEIETNGGDVQACDGAGGTWFVGAVGSFVYGHGGARFWGPAAGTGFARMFQLFSDCQFVYAVLPQMLSTNTPNDISFPGGNLKAYTDLPYVSTTDGAFMTILH
jgi:hypothetical protein